MSFQSTLDRFKEVQINRKELIWVLIGAVAGLVLGLLIGWVWWPVEWQGGSLSALSRETQAEYVSTVADAYATYSTQEALEQARQRLALLDGNLPTLFDAALVTYTARPDGSAQVANLAALASALGIPVKALPAAPIPADQAAQAPLPATPAAGVIERNEPNGFWNGLQFLASVIILAIGAYLGWLLFKRLRPATPQATPPAIGPLSQPAPAVASQPITAYSSAAPPRTAPPGYTAAQAAATQVQPVQPPAMGNVPPFEPEESGAGAPAPVRGGQPIAPSVAVPPAAPGAFIEDAPDDEEDDSPHQADATSPSTAVGQRPGASSLGWAPGVGRVERYPTIDHFEARFTAGMDHFDWTRNIPGPQEDVYLGEYGIGVSDRHGMLNNDPDQVVAIEVYIFDKSDEKNLVNVSRVVLSEYADTNLRRHFEREKDRLGPIVAQPKTTLQLEARQFILLCTINEVRYTPEGIFERVNMDLELKKKV